MESVHREMGRGWLVISQNPNCKSSKQAIILAENERPALEAACLGLVSKQLNNYRHLFKTSRWLLHFSAFFKLFSASSHLSRRLPEHF